MVGVGEVASSDVRAKYAAGIMFLPGGIARFGWRGDG